MGRVRKGTRIGKRLAKKPTEKVKQERKEIEEKIAREKERITRSSSVMFFSHNKALGPPYHVIMDTNFINKSVSNKLDILPSMIDCIYAHCNIYTTKCVIGELEKAGSKCKIALRIAKSPPVEILPCLHNTGVYADDCLMHYVIAYRHYIIATNDKGLKGRIRKIPGVPIMYVGNRKYKIEQLPEDPSAFL